MKILILAAGKGTRLEELTRNKPKCLVELRGKPIINYQLDIFKNLQLFDIVLIAGYKSEKLRHLSEKIIVNKEYDNTNMLYSLYCAIDEINGDILICYGDSVYDTSIIQDILQSNSEINVASDINWKSYWESRYDNPLTDLESYQINEEMNLVDIGKSPKSFSEIQGQYIGLIRLNKEGSIIFRKELLECHEKNNVNNKSFKNAYLTDFLQELVHKNYRIKSHSVSGDYIEIDTKDDIKSPITQLRISRIK